MTANLDPKKMATAEGEIESFATDRIVITGMFRPGDVLELRPGRRVFVFLEDDLDGLDIDSDDLGNAIGDAQEAAEAACGYLDDAQRMIEKLRTKATKRT